MLKVIVGIRLKDYQLGFTPSLSDLLLLNLLKHCLNNHKTFTYILRVSEWSTLIMFLKFCLLKLFIQLFLMKIQLPWLWILILKLMHHFIIHWMITCPFSHVSMMLNTYTCINYFMWEFKFTIQLKFNSIHLYFIFHSFYLEEWSV